MPTRINHPSTHVGVLYFEQADDAEHVLQDGMWITSRNPLVSTHFLIILAAAQHSFREGGALYKNNEDRHLNKPFVHVMGHMVEADANSIGPIHNM